MIPFTRMRKIIAERMHSRCKINPHFYLQMEVLADELVKLRGRMLLLLKTTDFEFPTMIFDKNCCPEFREISNHQCLLSR